ncbi:MAG: plasmid maintenance system killer protein [Candidatus Hydrogenedentota bacterium]
MIQSFACKETAKIFRREYSGRFPAAIQQAVLRKLRMLHRATSLDDLRVPPGNRLEKLSGDWQGFFSIRVNVQWRLCFEWRSGDAFNVSLVDYH